MSSPFRLAIVHYHLRPGGVTRVIGHAIEALAGRDVKTAVLAGATDARELPEGTTVQEVPGLGYAEDLSEPGRDLESLLSRLKAAARAALGGPPDLWHIHNHSLGKSGVLPLAVGRLAEEGHRLLLQIHDFPEDGRPANYRALLQHVGEGQLDLLGRRLYPQAQHVHYAVLNTRDVAFLLAAGIPMDRLHFLPNAVALRGEAAAPPAGQNRRLFLYPTRAIRRKNIGEFLLWSALGSRQDRFATTLAPTQPSDRAVYERWIEFARFLKLPVEFEAGQGGPLAFARLLQEATSVVTTSVSEGFGLAYLEPWLANRPLLGRDLPEMTHEFKRDNLDLSTLYTQLLVPLDWVGADRFRARLAEGLKRLASDYGRRVRAEDAQHAFAAACEGDRVDFGRLDEELQEIVIRRVAEERDARSEIVPARLLPDRKLDRLIRNNRWVTESLFNLQGYATRLLEIYRHVRQSEPGPAEPMNPKKLLDLFLAPDRFFLLRS